MRYIRNILLLAFLTVSGCAYFNAYYNSETAFNDAYRQHRKLMRDNPDSLIKPTGAILAGYDRAIAKSEKMLEVYPKDKKWPDDAIFMVGKANFYKCEFSKAVRKFKQLQDEYPGSPWVPQSFLLMGEAYLYSEDLTKAEDVLTQALARYPQLNSNEEISLLLAKIAIRREGKVQAIELLDKVKNSVLSEDKRIELILQLAQLNAELKQYTKAIDLLKSAPKRKKMVHQMFRIQNLLLECYLKADSLAPALKLCGEMLRNPDYTRYEARLQLRKAEILAALGRMPEAISLYETITERGDTSGAAKEAWFELGLIYQKQKGDFAKAKECFGKAVLSQDTLISRVARRHLDAMAMIDSLRSKRYTVKDKDTVVAKDSLSIPAYREFKIGELFWLQLEQADSAYGMFAALSRDSAKAGPLHSKSLYAAGYIALNSLKDTTRADSIFGVLTARYPQNPYSQRAQIDRGRQVTIFLRGDLAQDSLMQAEKLYVTDANPAAAVESYLKVVQDFPDCPDIAAKSLFAAAWICDEVLAKKKTARTLYEKVCADYPATEYCSQGAKPRLKAVLDSLAARNNPQAAAEQKKKEAAAAAASAKGDTARPQDAKGAGAVQYDPRMRKMPPIPQPYNSRGVPPSQPAVPAAAPSPAVAPAPVPAPDATPLSPPAGAVEPAADEEIIDSLH